MRIRILKPLAGVMDGVSLSTLALGRLYDVTPMLGRYLVGEQFAEEVDSVSPALLLPLDDPDAVRDLIGGVTVSLPFDGGLGDDAPGKKHH